MAFRPFHQTQDSLTEMFEYLDDLRESGVTNMFMSAPYLTASFEVDNREAGAVLVAWMDTYSPDWTAERRAINAMDKQYDAERAKSP